jgi:tRNA (guanine26-N2/guanine27-N2)-dimethyltransferase
MMEFKEGKATITVPAFTKVTSRSPVFYNPDMAFDRALSVHIFKASEKREVCDAFSGSGIRAILYALEGGTATANDYNLRAVELIKKNAESNNVSIEILNEDANMLLRKRKFEVLDVDPFGSPVQYLDSVMNGLKNGSFLFVTATDIKALCGYARKAALRKYGVNLLRTPFAKELGVRVLVTTVMREGAKYGFGFSVLFSYWRKHYIRVFLRAKWSKKAALNCMNEVNPVFFCGCGYFSFELDRLRICPVCGGSINWISPVYLGKIKDNQFLERIEHDLVKQVKEECDIPFYYDTHSLAKFHKIYPPKIDELISNLKGFSASRTIFCPTGVKTDAPLTTVLEVISSITC